MTNKDYYNLFKEQFGFLESKYRFEFTKFTKFEWGYEAIYLSSTTGVKVIYEFREAYIFITLYKLVNGGLQENPDFIEEDTLLHGFSLDDIILLANPKDLVKPAYEYGENSKYHNEENGIALYVAEFSHNLEKYGKEILNGNFKTFLKLDKVVKNRIRNTK